MNHSFAKIIFLIGSVCLIYLDKTTSLSLQGLSIEDLISTGLSTQFLGAIGLLALIKLYLSKSKNNFAYIFWITWIVLSHLVVSICMMIFIIFLIAVHLKTRSLEKAKNLIFCVIVSMGLTSFFWIPFVAQGDDVVKAKIIVDFPILIFVFYLLSWAFLNGRARLILFTALVLALPSVLSTLNVNLSTFFPPFHYYRLNSTTFWFALIGNCVFLSENLTNKTKSQWFQIKTVFALLIPLYFVTVSKKSWPVTTGGTNILFTDAENILKNNSNFNVANGRLHVIEPRRGIGFAVESYLAMNDPNLLTTKGLYWESHPSNRVLAFFLSSLFEIPTPLPSPVSQKLNCQQRMCFLNEYIRTYNISHFLTFNNRTKFMNSDLQRCFDESFFSGIRDFTFYQKREQNNLWTLYSVIKKPNSDWTTESNKTSFFEYTQSIHNQCVLNKEIFRKRIEHTNNYDLYDSENVATSEINFAVFSGLTFKASEPIKLNSSVLSNIKFEKTISFYIGYFLSFLTVGLCLLKFCVAKLKKYA